MWWTTLHRTYCAIKFCITVFSSVLRCTILWHTMSYSAMPYRPIYSTTKHNRNYCSMMWEDMITCRLIWLTLHKGFFNRKNTCWRNGALISTQRDSAADLFRAWTSAVPSLIAFLSTTLTTACLSGNMVELVDIVSCEKRCDDSTMGASCRFVPFSTYAYVL